MTVKAVAPGASAHRYRGLTEEAKSQLEDESRESLGTPDDVAYAVVFLASEQAGYITAPCSTQRRAVQVGPLIRLRAPSPRSGGRHRGRSRCVAPSPLAGKMWKAVRGVRTLYPSNGTARSRARRPGPTALQLTHRSPGDRSDDRRPRDSYGRCTVAHRATRGLRRRR